MMQITSPFITSKVTPFSTSSWPNDLCTSRSEMIGWSGVQAGAAFMGVFLARQPACAGPKRPSAACMDRSRAPWRASAAGA